MKHFVSECLEFKLIVYISWKFNKRVVCNKVILAEHFSEKNDIPYLSIWNSKVDNIASWQLQLRLLNVTFAMFWKLSENEKMSKSVGRDHCLNFYISQTNWKMKNGQ